MKGDSDINQESIITKHFFTCAVSHSRLTARSECLRICQTSKIYVFFSLDSGPEIVTLSKLKLCSLERKWEECAVQCISFMTLYYAATFPFLKIAKSRQYRHQGNSNREPCTQHLIFEKVRWHLWITENIFVMGVLFCKSDANIGIKTAKYPTLFLPH